MTTEKPDNDARTSDTITAEPSDEYKGLQRKYEKARREKAEALAENAELRTRTQAVLDRVEERFDLLVKTFIDSGLLEEKKAQLQEGVNQIARKKDQSDRAAKSHRDMTALIEGAEADWDDEQFGEARKKWDAGDLEGAIADARTVLAKSKDQDVDAIVEAKVQAKLKERGRVDTGGSTAPGGKKYRLSDLSSIGDISGRSNKEQIADIARARKDLDAAYDQMKR